MALTIAPNTGGYYSSWGSKTMKDKDLQGWVKDGDLNTAHGQTVKPLPFHGMSSYPYGENESYPSDKEHRDYLEKYNTRQVSTEAFTRALSDKDHRE